MILISENRPACFCSRGAISRTDFHASRNSGNMEYAAGESFAWREVPAHGALVGSQQVRRFSLNRSRISISSALISKSKTSESSKMRLRLADLGITTSPCCNAQRIRICAGDLVSETRDNLSKRGNRDQGVACCGSTLEYFLATATSFGSFRRTPLARLRGFDAK